MGWKQVVDWSSTEKRNILIPSVDTMHTSMPNIGDYIGNAAVIEVIDTVNDLTGNIGDFVCYSNVSTTEVGAWQLTDVSTYSTSATGIIGIVTSNTSASTPVILLEGVIRMDGADFSPAIAQDDLLLGKPVFLSPSTIGKGNCDATEFNTLNMVRTIGHVLDFDINNTSSDEEFFLYFKPDVINLEL